MLAALDSASAASDDRDCEAIADAASTVANEAAALPDSDVKLALIEGAENLAALANDRNTCEPRGPTGPEDVQTTPTPAPQPEETTPAPTQPPDEPQGPPPTPEQPPGEGGGGIGGGNEGGQPPTGGTGGD